jgi:hypothetical protein
MRIQIRRERGAPTRAIRPPNAMPTYAKRARRAAQRARLLDERNCKLSSGELNHESDTCIDFVYKNHETDTFVLL